MEDWANSLVFLRLSVFMNEMEIWIYFKSQYNLYISILLGVVMVSLDGSYRFQIWYLFR